MASVAILAQVCGTHFHTLAHRSPHITHHCYAGEGIIGMRACQDLREWRDTCSWSVEFSPLPCWQDTSGRGLRDSDADQNVISESSSAIAPRCVMHYGLAKTSLRAILGSTSSMWMRPALPTNIPPVFPPPTWSSESSTSLSSPCRRWIRNGDPRRPSTYGC